MSPAPLPELPPELLDRIAWAALESDVSAWVRLSRVCRSWRDILRGGAPLVLKPNLTSEQLRAALRNIPVTNLTLHHSFMKQELTYGELVWALAGLTPTLTALYGLPLEELHDSRPLGLAAFSRLQALTLRRQPDEYAAVRATLLPQSLTALRLEAADPGAGNQPGPPPRLIAMGRLHRLQAITIVGHEACRLSYEEEEEFGPIPRSLEVLRLENYHIPVAHCSIKTPAHGTVHHEEYVGGDHEHLLPTLRRTGVTLEAVADVVTLEACYAPQYSSGGIMSAWQGNGTDLAWGYVAIRIQTNHWKCLAEEGPALAGSEASAHHTIHPLQLLCRTLRLAPASYCRFEISAARSDAPLTVESTTGADLASDLLQLRQRADFATAAQLAAAMRPFATSEGINVKLSVDGRVAIVSRDGAEPACRQA